MTRTHPFPPLYLAPLLGALGACSRGSDPIAAAPEARPEPAGVALELAQVDAVRQPLVADDAAEMFGPWSGPIAPTLETTLAARPAPQAADGSAAEPRPDLLAEDLLRRGFRAEREVARLGREREAARAAQDPFVETLEAELLAATRSWNDLAEQLAKAQALDHLAWIPRTARTGATEFAELYRTDSLEDLYLENIALDQHWAVRIQGLVDLRFAAGLYETDSGKSFTMG